MGESVELPSSPRDLYWCDYLPLTMLYTLCKNVLNKKPNAIIRVHAHRPPASNTPPEHAYPQAQNRDTFWHTLSLFRIRQDIQYTITHEHIPGLYAPFSLSSIDTERPAGPHR